MCACKESDVRESPNTSTPADGEGHGSHGETFQPIYGESPVSSVAEHPLQCIFLFDTMGFSNCHAIRGVWLKYKYMYIK
jgi:hypothetical protein